MKIWTMPALLLLAACSGGDERSDAEDTAAISSAQKAAPAIPADAPNAEVDADLPTAKQEASTNPASDPVAGDGAAIPAAIRGRWALNTADCTAKKGADLTAVTIDATNLRFYESHGELTHVRESGANRLVADYRFSGEGQEWDRRNDLTLADGGKMLVRRDMGEGAAAGAMRYTRCAG